MIQHCLWDMKLDSILIYQDDVVVFSATIKEHIAHLQAFLVLLHQYELKFKSKKYHPKARHTYLP